MASGLIADLYVKVSAQGVAQTNRSIKSLNAQIANAGGVSQTAARKQAAHTAEVAKSGMAADQAVRGHKKSAAAIGQTGRDSQKAARGLGMFGSSMTGAGRSAGQAGGRFAGLRTSVGGLRKSLVDAGGGSAGLNKGLKQIAVTMSPTASMAAQTGAAFGPGAAVAGVGVGLAYGLFKAGQAAIQFESDFAGVAKTFPGTEKQLAAVRTELREMAREMPTTTTELAGIAEIAGQLGVEAGSVTTFTRTIAMLGETTNLVGEEGATAIARFMNIFQTPQKDVDRLGSTVVALGNNMATTEAETLEFGLRLAGAGKVAGFTEGQVLAIGASLSSVGINAEAGGTAVSKVMIDIASAADEGGEQIAAFAKVAGMSATLFTEQWEADPAKALLSFVEGLGRVKEQGGSTFQVLEDLGIKEQRMRDALLRSSSASDVLAQALGLQRDEMRDNTALTDEYGKRVATTESGLRLAGNAVKDLAITFGSELLPAVNSGAEGFAGFVSGLNDFIQGRDTGIRLLDILPTDADIEQWARTHIAAFANWGRSAEEVSSKTRTLKAVQADGARFAGAYGLEQQAARMATAAAGDAAQEAAGGLDALGSSTEDAAEATLELSSGTQAVLQGIQGWMAPLMRYQELLAGHNEKLKASAQDSADSHNKHIDRQIAKIKDQTGKTEAEMGKQARAKIESLEDQKRSSDDYYEQQEASFSLYMQGLDEQLADQREWHKNLNRIREAAGSEYADMLAQQGPEYAALHSEIADQSRGEIRKAANAENRLREEAGAEQLRMLERTGEVNIAELDRTGKIQVDHTGVVVGAMVDELADKLGVSRAVLKDIFGDNKQILVAQLKAMKGVTTDGSGRIVDAMGNKLQGGAKVISKVVSQYGKLLAEGLNPVIASVGGKTIAFRSVDAARFAGRYTKRAAGGVDYRGMVEQTRDSGAYVTDRLSVVHGEPETHGEAWIPFARSKRGRSRQIADVAVDKLGGRVEWMADGGFASTKSIPKVPAGSTPSGAFGDSADMSMGYARDHAEKWLEKNLAPDIGGISGPGRYQAMFAAVRKQFPDVQLLSGLRPGAITATGNASYHGMGRAVDISPRMDIFNWLAKNYAATELIFSPAGGRQEWHGKPHVYSEPTRGDHWDHIHWAMANGGILEGLFDSGGVLKPGTTVATNKTGRNEVVAAQGMIAAEVASAMQRTLQKQLEHLNANLEDMRGNVDARDENQARGQLVTELQQLRADTRRQRRDMGRDHTGEDNRLRRDLRKADTGKERRQARKAIKRQDKQQKSERRQLEAGYRRDRRDLQARQREFERDLREQAKSDLWNAQIQALEDAMQAEREYIESLEQAYDDAVAAQQSAFDDLNRLLDERAAILGQIADAQQRHDQTVLDARRQYDEQFKAAEKARTEATVSAVEQRNERLADVEEQFNRDYKQIVADRAGALSAAFDPQQRVEQQWANSIGSVTRNIRAQVEEFSAWAANLDMLRTMGLSEDAIAALGLEDLSAESLATVKAWRSATETEIADLNAAVASRNRAGADRAQLEAARMVGEIGKSLTDLSQQAADETASIHRDHAEALADANRQFHESAGDLRRELNDRLADAGDELTDEMSRLTAELAAVGQDQGRSYAEALREGLESGIPGIVDAARRAQEAARGVESAKRSVNEAKRSTGRGGAGSPVKVPPSGRLYDTQNLGLAVRFADKTWWAAKGSEVSFAQKLWGPAIAHPAINASRVQGRLMDKFGMGGIRQFTAPNAAPKYFARGGYLTRPTPLAVAGEAGSERIKVEPLTKDVATPSEKRVEALLARIAQAVEESDGTVMLDGRVLAGEVTRRQRQAARGERVAAGSAGWR